MKVRVADLNNDGRDEVVLLHSSRLGDAQNNGLWVLKVAGDSPQNTKFQEHQYIPVEQGDALEPGSDVRLVDLDRDGALDAAILLVRKQSGALVRDLWVIYGDKSMGGFDPKTLQKIPVSSGQCTALATGQVTTTSGERSLLVSVGTDTSHQVFRWSTNGRTGSLVKLGAVQGGTWMDTGDFNGDGVTDIVSGNGQTMNMYLGVPSLR